LKKKLDICIILYYSIHEDLIMEKNKLIQRHILLPKWLNDEINKIAKRDDLKFTAIARKALKFYLEKSKK